MKIFACSCGNLVHFENNRCVWCQAHLAYLPEKEAMIAFGEDDAPPPDTALCGNALEHGVCNWLVRRDEDEKYCRSCRLNQTIPDLSDHLNLLAWAKIEKAKRRLIYTILSWNLPLPGKGDDATHRLAFAFLGNQPGLPPVITGHADGLITLNIAEADDPFREKARQSLGETYRTLLGHFRHESGHYYWDVLVKPNAERLRRFRALFGDETVAYERALDEHYGGEAKTEWESSFVSAYAAAHPWEDWAETWAHVMHLWDTMETAAALGLSLAPRPSAKRSAAPKLDVPALERLPRDFDGLLASWPTLTMAINDLNRAMGLRDAYPFAPGETAREKMRFAYEVMSAYRARPPYPNQP